MRGSLEFPESAWRSPLLQRWRETFAAKSEAPESFHFAAAIFVVGIVVGHRVRFRYGYDIYLNFYLFLLGATGCKKTTALEWAIRMLRLIVPTVVPLQSVSTGEGVVQHAAKEPGTIVPIVENELAILLAKARRAESTLLSVLNRGADVPSAIDIPTRGNPLRAESPFIAILGASTREAIEERFGDEVALGGFGNRGWWIAGERQAANPFPRTPTQTELGAIVRDLEDIQHTFGSATVLDFCDDEARDAWARYYHRYYERQDTLSSIMAGLTSREHVHVLRASMLFAVLRGSKDISADDLNRAVELGEYLFAVVESVVQPIGQGSANRLEAKIEAFLTERAMTRRELHHRLSGRVKSRDLTMAIESLRDLECIVELDAGLLAWTDADYFTRRRAGAA